MQRLAEWFARGRGLLAAFLVVVTLAAYWGNQQLGHDAGSIARRGRPTAAERTYDEIKAEFDTSADNCYLLVDLPAANSDAHLFTPTAIAAIRKLVVTLETQASVADIIWLDQVVSLIADGVQPLLPPAGASVEEFAEARRRASVHPLVAGQLLSTGEREMLLVVLFDPVAVAGRRHEAVDEVAAIARQTSDTTPLRVRITGNTPLTIEAGRIAARENDRYMMIGPILAFVMAAWLFRGAAAVVIVSMAPLLGVYWTTGAMGLWGEKINPLNAATLPVLTMMIGFTDAIHLMIFIRRQRHHGQGQLDAAKSAIARVGLACFLTSITTAVGFLSLTIAEAVIVQRFGWVCALGVCLTFLAVIVLVPLLSTTWIARRIDRGYGRDIVHRNLHRFEFFIDAVIRRATPLSAIGIALTIALAASVFWLKPDSRLIDDFPATSEPAQTLVDVDRHFGGILTINATVDWPEGDTLATPEVIDALAEVDAILGGARDVRYPISVLNLLELAPPDASLATRVALLNFAPPELLRSMVRPDLRRALVTARVQDKGYAYYQPIYADIRAQLDELAARYPGFQFRLTGRPLVRGRVFNDMILDLAKSVALASVIIFGILTVALKSLRLGLISVLPNLFPLAVTSAALVACGLPLQMTSVCAFTICLGIAVDDTIHFLSRFQHELDDGHDVKTAVRRSFVSVGAALVTTTVVLTAGFSTVLFSSMPMTRLFGALACGTILSALLGDMVFLPALLVRFVPNRPRKQEMAATQSAPPTAVESAATGVS